MKTTFDSKYTALLFEINDRIGASNIVDFQAALPGLSKEDWFVTLCAEHGYSENTVGISSGHIRKFFTRGDKITSWFLNLIPNYIAAGIVTPKQVRDLDGGRSEFTEHCDVAAQYYWKDLCAKYDMKALAEKFGRETVIEARKLLTVNEFELRFGL